MQELVLELTPDEAADIVSALIATISLCQETEPALTASLRRLLDNLTYPADVTKVLAESTRRLEAMGVLAAMRKYNR